REDVAQIPYDDLVEHCCDVWNKLVDIMSIGMRQWAQGFSMGLGITGSRSAVIQLPKSLLAAIMHQAERFCATVWRRAPTLRPGGSVWSNSSYYAHGVDVPLSAARRGTPPRGSWA